jgi:hypothetical protein
MITILERGSQGASAAGPGERLFRFGPPPRVSPGLTLSCHIGDRITVYQQSGAQSWVLPWEKREDGIFCRLSAEETIVFLQRRWGQDDLLQTLDLSSRVYIVPFQAWWQGQWYDHDLCYFQEGRRRSWIGPGSAGRLVLTHDQGPSHVGGDQNWFLHRAQAWKQSLALAMRRKLGSLPGLLQVRIIGWSARTAALLLGLRAAYPEGVIGLVPECLPPTPAWKRMCQNLDIDLRGAARQGPTIDLDGLWPTGEERLLAAFLTAFQSIAPIVPEKLLQSWSQAGEFS